MKNEATQTMQECGIDNKVFQEILNTLNSEKANELVDLRGVGKFIKYPPKTFKQLAETEDGKLAITFEVRDWEIGKGSKIKSGTSKKIHIRTKFLNKKGEIVYGYDLASFNADKELVSSIVSLLIRSLEILD